jgi:seryl-tRNA synthetase
LRWQRTQSFINEQVESKEFELVYVPTTMMQADFMTKNLPRPKFEKDIFAIGLVEDRQGKVLKKSRI